MKPPSEAPSIPRASRAQGHSRPSSKPLLDCAANTLCEWGVGGTMRVSKRSSEYFTITVWRAKSKVMTKCVMTIAMFISVGLAVLPSVGHAQVSPPLAQKASDAAEMVGIAGKKGYVRIIAEFAGPVAANQLRADPAQLAPVRRQIASMQDAIITSHFGSALTPRAGQGFQRGLVRFD